jgi:hypothetical protein
MKNNNKKKKKPRVEKRYLGQPAEDFLLAHRMVYISGHPRGHGQISGLRVGLRFRSAPPHRGHHAPR